MKWDSKQYLQYINERTQPAVDLVKRIPMENPASALDVGCGPGNSTAIIKAQFPNAHVLGIDNSEDTHFYEWDKAKRKAAFSRSDSSLLCFAGVYRVDDEGHRFVILTTEANESVLPVHERMPLVLDQEQIADWIDDDRQTQAILRQKMPAMARRIEPRARKSSELYLFPDFEG